MKQATTLVRDHAAKELREVLVSTEALLSTIGDEGGESVQELRNRLTRTVADVRKELGQSFFDTARDRYYQARDTATSINRFAHQHPWLTISIGAGIGVLVGRLMRD
jgi:ElaB/YqjD/DUF883 family membrane-anchored ribosome-binding protein